MKKMTKTIRKDFSASSLSAAKQHPSSGKVKEADNAFWIRRVEQIMKQRKSDFLTSPTTAEKEIRKKSLLSLFEFSPEGLCRADPRCEEQDDGRRSRNYQHNTHIENKNPILSKTMGSKKTCVSSLAVNEEPLNDAIQTLKTGEDRLCRGARTNFGFRKQGLRKKLESRSEKVKASMNKTSNSSFSETQKHCEAEPRRAFKIDTLSKTESVTPDLVGKEDGGTKIPRSKQPVSKSFVNMRSSAMDNRGQQNVVMAMKQEIAKTLKKARSINATRASK